MIGDAPTLLSQVKIIPGETWTQTFQIADNPQYIVSSTATTPIVLTIPDHGYTNGQKIYVVNHDQVEANGTWVAASVTADTVALTGTTAGDAAGTRSGFASLAIDGTGSNVYVIIQASPIDKTPLYIFSNVGSPTSPLLNYFTWTTAPVFGTFAWVTQNILRFSTQLSSAQTGAMTDVIQPGNTATIWVVDGSGVTKKKMIFTILVGP